MPEFRSRETSTTRMLGAVLALALLVAGCSTGRTHDTIAESDSTIETPNGLTAGAGMTPAALGIADTLELQQSLHELNSQPSTGRFPAGIAVARLDPAPDPSRAASSIRVSKMAPDRAVYWTHLTDTLPAIREVTILRDLGIDPRGGRFEDVLRQALAVNCELCLLYGQVSQYDTDAEFIAVLWDALNGKPLTFFRAIVDLPPDLRKECNKRGHVHDRDCDAVFLAEAELRIMVRDHLWDRVQRDQVSSTTVPSPWGKDLPLFPRDYYRYREPRGPAGQRSGP